MTDRWVGWGVLHWWRLDYNLTLHFQNSWFSEGEELPFVYTRQGSQYVKLTGGVHGIECMPKPYVSVLITHMSIFANYFLLYSLLESVFEGKIKPLI